MRRPVVFLVLLAWPAIAGGQAALDASQAADPGAAPAVAPAGPPISTVRVSQVAVDLPAIDVWVSVKDSADQPVKGVPPEAFKVSVDGTALDVKAVQPPPVKGTTAWVLLVDCSKTMAGAPFASAMEASKRLVQGLGPDDRLAIIRFGTDVSVVSDFGKDKAALVAALSGLTPEDNFTRLFQAMQRAAEMLRVVGSSFPARRGILLVTDGKDEGSGTTIDDLVNAHALEVPVLAVGYSRQRNWDFADLNRLAVVSGGAFLEGPDPARIGQAFADLVRRHQDVYLVRSEWPGGKPDGSWRHVHVTVTSGGGTLPHERSAAMVSSGGGPEPGQEPVPDVAEDVVRGGGGIDATVWLPIGAGVLLLVAVVAFAVRGSRPKPGQAGAGAGGGGEPGGEIHRPPAVGPTVGPTVHPPVSPPRFVAHLTLISLKGESRLEPPGPRFGIPQDGLTIGRSGDVRVAGDDEVSARHCRVTWSAPHCYVEDLGARNPLLRNGGVVKGRERLDDDDVLQLGRTRIRVRLLGDER